MKCKTTNFMRALNTEFNGNLHDKKKCDKQKDEIIISVAKYLKIEEGKCLLKLYVQKNKRRRNAL
jgi:hypothetical protein